MQIPRDHIEQHQAETDAEQEESKGNTSRDDQVILGDLIALDRQQMHIILLDRVRPSPGPVCKITPQIEYLAERPRERISL